jgi:spermidine synthase
MSTVGSIAGTFATGFVLISWFGTHAIVMGVAVILLCLGLLLALGGRWRLLLPALLLVAVDTGLLWRAVSRRLPCTRETNYFCIKVRDEDDAGETVRKLILDRLVHSYTSLEDPTRLHYGYEQIYAEATAYRAQRDDHLSALFIGGGGYTFPRYMETVYPGSDIHVIEIDPGVTAVGYQYMGLKPDTSIVTYNEDARLYLRRPPTRKYDLVMGDAFNDFSVPYHLTTKEFNELVRAWLEPDGFYMVNLIDGPSASFLRAYTYTLRQTFSHVYLIPPGGDWHRAPRTTFILLASDAPLDLAAFESIDAGDGEPRLARTVLSQEATDAFLAEGRRVLLTDQYAPVDQMLASVYREEAPR